MTDNRTTELREELTERGVEWKDESNGFADVTVFVVNGIKWTVISKSYLNPENDWMTMNAERITPEQAIAATLGSGTITAEQVEIIVNRNCEWYEGGELDAQAIADQLNATLGWGTCEDVSTKNGIFKCSKCGCTVKEDGVDWGEIHHCPDCGKAVKR